MTEQHPVGVCERCGRPIHVGRAYSRGSAPGLIVHRGPCVVIGAPDTTVTRTADADVPSA